MDGNGDRGSEGTGPVMGAEDRGQWKGKTI